MLSSLKNKNFIIQNFPPDYEDLTYIELFVGKGTLLLGKKPSKEEIINDENQDFVMQLRTLRDQPGYCIRSLKKIKIGESIEPKSKIEAVVQRYGTKIKKKTDITSAAERIKKLSDRLEEVYIISKPFTTVIRTFNNPNTFLFVNSLNKQQQASLEQVKLADNVNLFKGKVLLISYPSNYYNKSFKGWKTAKRNDLCLWRNWK